MADIDIYLRTAKVKNDGRVKKEINTLIKNGHEVKIYSIENNNKKETKLLNEKVQIQTNKLYSRIVLKQGKLLIVKILEMYFHFFIFWLKSNKGSNKVYWVHNIELLGFVLLLRKITTSDSQIIWDMHELVAQKMVNNKVSKYLFNQAIKSSDRIIMANEERKKHFINIFPQAKDKLVVINNYPTLDFVNKPINSNIYNSKKSPYFLFQGVAYEIRSIHEVIKAVLKFPTHNLLILGPILDSVKEDIISEYGEDFFKTKILNTGYISNDQMSKYIDSARISLIFYKDVDDNHIYCEPNRFYEAISRGIPIVCGKNPPMKKIIDKYKCGISIDDYGTDPKTIEEAINIVLNNYEFYKKNIDKIKNNYNWSIQEKQLLKLVTG